MPARLLPERTARGHVGSPTTSLQLENWRSSWSSLGGPPPGTCSMFVYGRLPPACKVEATIQHVVDLRHGHATRIAPSLVRRFMLVDADSRWWNSAYYYCLPPSPPAPARGPYINRKHPDSAVRGVHMSTCAWKAATNAQSKSHGETPHRSALKLHGAYASTRTCPVERIPLHLEQLCKDHRHHGDDDDDDDDNDDVLLFVSHELSMLVCSTLQLREDRCEME